MPSDADGPGQGPGRAARLLDRGRHLQSEAGRRLLTAREEHASVRLLTDALREDRDTGGALLAGALAFRLFLWLLPAALVVVALFGFSSPDRVRTDLTQAGLGGFMASTISQATAQAHQGRWILLLIGVVALYSTSVALAKAMWIGTSLAWHLPVARLHRSPRAAAAVVVLMMLAVTLTLAAGWVRSVAYTVGVVVTLVMLALYTLLGWYVLSVLPRPAGASVVDLLPGALLIGAGVQVLHLVSAFYLVNRISTSSQLYGALGAAATVLLWGYLLARVLIGASTLNRTLGRYRDAARLPTGNEHAAAVPLRGLAARLRADWRDIVAGTHTGGPGPSDGPDPTGAGQAAALTVWRFDDETGAQAAGRTLGELERRGALRVLDAAVVTWPTGASRPRASQLASTRASGALGGSFWGLLLGIIFFAPVLGLAVGAAAGALGGSLREAGIGETFIRQVRDEVTPGTSALFVMTSDVDLDEVRTAFLAHHPTLLHTNLTPEQDAALREYFDA
ncbi:YhjD/YihY/BrkB family envelope integrity protein [Intrasporangium sp. YIM S08009]|uniref:YhjD/YihY/BrkB family envelope integrity protein n=1 Tax=Intrasporangium zincisolvens TaxID=3080018 RepID=UPI002B05BECD|nr:YhjD/YihY/BrkB family envelope integrity protein [Intrasporangium sp. YIM S08009]